MLKKALIVPVVLLVAALVQTQFLAAQSTLDPCENVSIQLLKPESGTTLTGKTTLAAHVSPANNLHRLEFYLDQKLLGAAKSLESNSTNAYQAMEWDSAMAPNGSYRLHALAYFTFNDRSGYKCQSSSVNVAINNQVKKEATLRLVLSQSKWSGPVNVPATLSAEAFLQDTDGNRSNITSSTSFKWSTTIGSLRQSGHRAEFFSGSRVGEGQVRVVGHHSGQEVAAAIPIRVKAALDTTTFPSSTTVETADERATTDDTRTETASTHSSDPGLESCLITALGEERYRAVIESRQRLAIIELASSFDCFAQRKFILPASFSPISTETVRELPLAPELVNTTTVRNIDFADRSGIIRTGLLLSGTAPPGSLVLIYIYSEPLVLTTKSDHQGRWTYTLEEPLTPGEHSIYVAVEGDGSQMVRSVPFLVTIVEAQATDDNPTGASLMVADSGERFLQYYLAAAIVLVAIGLATAFFLIVRRLNRPAPSGV